MCECTGPDAKPPSGDVGEEPRCKHGRPSDTCEECRVEALDRTDTLTREENVRYPNPLSIGFGYGRFIVGVYSNLPPKPGYGVCIQETGTPGKIGLDAPPSPDDPHDPIPGEVYLDFANGESAEVVQDAVNKVVAKFRSDASPPQAAGETTTEQGFNALAKDEKRTFWNRPWCSKCKMPRPCAYCTVRVEAAGETLEGDMVATEGDWIIKGVKDEFYPCKPDIFAATYEPESPPTPTGETDGEIVAKWRRDHRGDDLSDVANASIAIPNNVVRAALREIDRLIVKCRGSLANNLCPDHRDKQSGKTCLACEIDRLTKENECLDKSLVMLEADRDSHRKARGTLATDLTNLADGKDVVTFLAERVRVLLAAKDAEVERLTKERDEALGRCKVYIDSANKFGNECDKALAELAALRERLSAPAQAEPPTTGPVTVALLRSAVEAWHDPRTTTGNRGKDQFIADHINAALPKAPADEQLRTEIADLKRQNGNILGDYEGMKSERDG